MGTNTLYIQIRLHKSTMLTHRELNKMLRRRKNTSIPGMQGDVILQPSETN